MNNGKLSSFIETISYSLDPEVGLSEKYPIWKKNKATLWYYPSPNRRYKEPIFLIYSLVNKAYILDLAPSISLIEAFTQAGYDTYLIDFGIPGFEDRNITIDDYLTKYIEKGYKRAIRHAGTDEMTVIGFCLGGTLATIFAAITKQKMKNLILAVSPIDFSTFPVYGNWLEALRNGDIYIDDLVDKMGMIPPSSIKYGTRLLVSPVAYSHYLALLNQANNPSYREKWTRMNKWTIDHIPLSKESFKQIMNDLIRDNKIVEGGLVIDNQPVDFQNIHCNLLVFSTKSDPLVPSSLCEPIMDLVASKDKTFTLFEGGHASLVAKGTMPYPMEEWLINHTTLI
ncbi:alpha/beta fold hydrolase [Niallia nealsonii]|uniref:Hydroxyalkanoic acid synthase n=1 Tax=Niallia nealsonii TaxID=115979 RepID=A0A2N0Z282_9BACI|nr:alpha/beta fold hydrolase [Niallia nealsonii]PKG23628.1 hydroxyalkanoic acid synthase [Niallia nealsonii]